MTAEVLILHTGGTIGMVPGPHGLARPPACSSVLNSNWAAVSRCCRALTCWKSAR
ncbi:hypothetical protein ULG90_12325 [Halopseudomonas pachastrellae]|nr:hypothetical protein ULG90_12325 [Halopseudomonas pachastrellae]